MLGIYFKSEMESDFSDVTRLGWTTIIDAVHNWYNNVQLGSNGME
jgi:hypothetical protein